MKKPIYLKYKRQFFILFSLIILISLVFLLLQKKTPLKSSNEFNKEINKLKSEQDYLNSEIKQDKELINKLKNNQELEKFAREEYHMKKENEEIYLIEYDTLVKK